MKLLVFTYAPAGLGHLRVTGALVKSKPKDLSYVLLGSNDKFMTSIHRFTSVNPVARKIFENSQYGLAEDIFTKIYVWVLRRSTQAMFSKLLEIIDEHPGVTELTVVATHFGMAHQIGEIKELITKQTGVKVNLVVQVTDDSSQHIWCIKGADITMVPSAQTKDELSEYAKQKKIEFNCVVSPYPLSPLLIEKIPYKEGERSHAFQKGENDQINIILPISGAAVGLSYHASLMNALDKLSNRFHFLVVAKRSSATRDFLMKISRMKWVELITGRNDNEVVRLYEKTYQENLIHIEITKPSEQAFKAMISPSLVGGSILLFTTPVGRQEFDNINFLKRHCLLPLGDKESGNNLISNGECIPRGIRLPSDPEVAAKFIMWCLEKGLFLKMSDSKFEYSPKSLMTGEINEKGAWLFWEELKIAKMV